MAKAAVGGKSAGRWRQADFSRSTIDVALRGIGFARYVRRKAFPACRRISRTEDKTPLFPAALDLQDEQGGRVHMVVQRLSLGRARIRPPPKATVGRLPAPGWRGTNDGANCDFDVTCWNVEIVRNW